MGKPTKTKKATRSATRRTYGRIPVRSQDGKWKRSLLEVEFAKQVNGRVPAWVEELEFFPGRKWRLDFAWPDSRVACEIQGGTWRGGRHTRGAGFEGDCEKFNSATEQGWKVYKFTSKMVRSGEAARIMERVLS